MAQAMWQAIALKMYLFFQDVMCFEERRYNKLVWDVSQYYIDSRLIYAVQMVMDD